MSSSHIIKICTAWKCQLPLMVTAVKKEAASVCCCFGVQGPAVHAGGEALGKVVSMV